MTTLSAMTRPFVRIPALATVLAFGALATERVPGGPGPPGTERVLAGLRETYTLDAGYRVSHHGAEFARPGGFGGTPMILTVPDGSWPKVELPR